MSEELLLQADEYLKCVEVLTHGSGAKYEKAVKDYKKCSSPEHLIKALADEVRGKEWQPIETAPKDGDDIFVGNEDEFQAIAQWWVDGWYSLCHDERFFTAPLPLCFKPTKWQPLPPPPKGSAND